MTARGRVTAMVNVVAFRDLCMHCAISTRGGARAGALEAQIRSLQDALLAIYNDRQGARDRKTVLRPWPIQPGESAPPNTALHQGQDCVLSLLWQARECAQALPLAQAQRQCHKQDDVCPLVANVPGGALGRRHGRGGGARLTARTQHRVRQPRAAPGCRL
jgi:hypothetical protein